MFVQVFFIIQSIWIILYPAQKQNSSKKVTFNLSWKIHSNKVHM